MTKTNVKTPPHLSWLVDTGKKLKAACGTEVDILELKHTNDAAILSAWAKHFRNQYCDDNKIDVLKGKLSRKEYLENIKFPSKTNALGPPIRAGDFAEILLADYLEWGLKYWVPRLRWDMKPVANDSAKGCDIIGFHFAKDGKATPSDVLAIIESKASLSGQNKGVLQNAVVDSAKDDIRKAESLNYHKPSQRSFRCRQATAQLRPEEPHP
jgi:Cap4 SAVED domain